MVADDVLLPSPDGLPPQAAETRFELSGDTSEGWTCSVCHPAPDGMATLTPHSYSTLDATA